MRNQISTTTIAMDHSKQVYQLFDNETDRRFGIASKTTLDVLKTTPVCFEPPPSVLSAWFHPLATLSVNDKGTGKPI